jgi:hypothetical protein
MGLFQPFFSYNNNFSYFYPSIGLETPTTTQWAGERYDHIAGSGNQFSYFVGDRDVKRVSFAWQTNAQLTEWLAWWDAVKDGSEFVYHDDDSYTLSGTGTCGTGTCGTLSRLGASDNNTAVKITNKTFEMQPMDVSGQWKTPVIELRVVE